MPKSSVWMTDANEVDLLYSTAGTYNYDFVVTNNFGCQWDTTVQVVVIDNPGTSLSTGTKPIARFL